MKNIFKSILCVAVAAMAFTACSTADINEEVTAPQTVTVKVNAVADNLTRTSFGEYDSENTAYPTLWSVGDKVKASLGAGNGATSDKLTEGGETASFEIGFNLNTVPTSGPYAVYLVSPSSAVSSSTLSDSNTFNITIPTTQTTSTTSCDPTAQILYGKSAESQTKPNTCDVTFSHAVAYIKFSLTNLPAESTVNAVTISSESNIAGKYTLAFNGTLTDNGASNEITVTTSSASDIWVALAPCEVATLTFSVSTNNGLLEKTVSIPTGKKFEAGKIVGFSVNMSGATSTETVTYALVKDVANLAVGDEIIIAALNYDKAISTTQASNNRTATDITKDGDGNITNPNETVELLRIQAGYVDNTYSLHTTISTGNNAGILYNASSSSKSYLRTHTGDMTAEDSAWNEERQQRASWSISIDSTTGEATITSNVSTDTTTRSIVKYNTNGTGLFNCYASGQQSIGIYKKITE